MPDRIEVIDADSAAADRTEQTLRVIGEEGSKSVVKMVHTDLFVAYERDDKGRIKRITDPDDSHYGDFDYKRDIRGRKKIGPLLLTWMPAAYTQTYVNPNPPYTETNPPTLTFTFGAWVAGAGGSGAQYVVTGYLGFCSDLG